VEVRKAIRRKRSCWKAANKASLNKRLHRKEVQDCCRQYTW